MRHHPCAFRASCARAARRSPCSPATTRASPRSATQAGVDILLVGDSLGMVVQGHDCTLPVTLEQMEYHVAHAWRAARRSALIVADMPFGSFQDSPQQAFAQRGARSWPPGAQMVKLEGGAADGRDRCASWSSAASRCAATSASRRSRCTRSAATGCRARPTTARARLLEDAQRARAGGRRHDRARRRCRPRSAKQVTEALARSHHRHRRRPGLLRARCWCCTTCSTSIPAARRASCELHGRRARHAGAIGRYVEAVKSGAFPAPEHTF